MLTCFFSHISLFSHCCCCDVNMVWSQTTTLFSISIITFNIWGCFFLSHYTTYTHIMSLKKREKIQYFALKMRQFSWYSSSFFKLLFIIIDNQYEFYYYDYVCNFTRLNQFLLNIMLNKWKRKNVLTIFFSVLAIKLKKNMLWREKTYR